MDFVILVDHWLKIKENKKMTQVLRPCQRTEKAVEHEGDGDTNGDWSTWNGPQKIGKRTVKFQNQRSNQNYPDNGIVEIG